MKQNKNFPGTKFFVTISVSRDSFKNFIELSKFFYFCVFKHLSLQKNFVFRQVFKLFQMFNSMLFSKFTEEAYWGKNMNKN